MPEAVARLVPVAGVLSQHEIRHVARYDAQGAGGNEVNDLPVEVPPLRPRVENVFMRHVCIPRRVSLPPEASRLPPAPIRPSADCPLGRLRPLVEIHRAYIPRS